METPILANIVKKIQSFYNFLKYGAKSNCGIDCEKDKVLNQWLIAMSSNNPFRTDPNNPCTKCMSVYKKENAFSCNPITIEYHVNNPQASTANQTLTYGQVPDHPNYFRLSLDLYITFNNNDSPISMSSSTIELRKIDWQSNAETTINSSKKNELLTLLSSTSKSKTFRYTVNIEDLGELPTINSFDIWKVTYELNLNDSYNLFSVSGFKTWPF